MTTQLRTRLSRIEKQRGSDALDRHVKSLTEDQLDARIEELTVRLRSELEAQGHECASMNSRQLVQLAQKSDPTWPRAFQ